MKPVWAHRRHPPHGDILSLPSASPSPCLPLRRKNDGRRPAPGGFLQLIEALISIMRF
jgi:hypothetical protein